MPPSPSSPRTSYPPSRTGTQDASRDPEPQRVESSAHPRSPSLPQQTIDPKKPAEKAILFAGLLRGDARRELERPLDELASLADTAEIVVKGELVQKRDKPDPATFVGSGTVE